MNFIKSDKLKEKPKTVTGFGKIFTDYMFVNTYDFGWWGVGTVCPYDGMALLPCTSVLHYGQAAFEGLKAYRNDKGEVRLFRARDNFKRLRTSCERLCIPPLDVEECYNGLVKLVDIERDWIPTEEGTSLYIRPFVFAVDEGLGVHAAEKYKFVIILSPSGAYYSRGFKPVALKVEREYVRACKGGTGAHKVVGNYAASILAGELAKRSGYDQVLWLDAAERKYVEEVGSMNIFFVLDGKVVTPSLNGTILPGITRDSVIKLALLSGLEVEERRISIDEVIAGAKSGTLTEIFGTGTAAVVSPVDRLGDGNVEYIIGEEGRVGPVSQMLYDKLTSVQTGKVESPFADWVTIV